MKQSLCCFLLILFTLASCSRTNKKEPAKNEDTSNQEKDISTLQGSEMLSSMEQQASKDKNSIYTSVFLLAWQEVSKKYEGPVVCSQANTEEFIRLVESNSYIGSLREEEYKKTVEFNDGLHIQGIFEKSLPFFQEFRRSKYSFKFKQIPVTAFGMPNFYDEEAKNIKVLYYRNDDVFAIQLKLKDPDHEMVLAKGLSPSDSLLGLVNQVEYWIELGEKEKENVTKQWKYSVNYEDRLLIPILDFNISSRFPSIAGQKFSINNKEHFVADAYEKITFTLNEKGGEIEVEFAITTDSATATEEDIEIELPHPKIMHFNKPFLFYLKKRDANDPYFVVKVENTELMIPF